METFLDDIVQNILVSHAKMDQIKIIVPNIRAISFLKESFKKFIDRPLLAPEILTISEFIDLEFKAYTYMVICVFGLFNWIVHVIPWISKKKSFQQKVVQTVYARHITFQILLFNQKGNHYFSPNTFLP